MLERSLEREVGKMTQKEREVLERFAFWREDFNCGLDCLACGCGGGCGCSVGCGGGCSKGCGCSGR